MPLKKRLSNIWQIIIKTQKLKNIHTNILNSLQSEFSQICLILIYYLKFVTLCKLWKIIKNNTENDLKSLAMKFIKSDKVLTVMPKALKIAAKYRLSNNNQILS